MPLHQQLLNPHDINNKIHLGCGRNRLSGDSTVGPFLDSYVVPLFTCPPAPSVPANPNCSYSPTGAPSFAACTIGCSRWRQIVVDGGKCSRLQQVAEVAANKQNDLIALFTIFVRNCAGSKLVGGISLSAPTRTCITMGNVRLLCGRVMPQYTILLKKRLSILY